MNYTNDVIALLIGSFPIIVVIFSFLYQYLLCARDKGWLYCLSSPISALFIIGFAHLLSPVLRIDIADKLPEENLKWISSIILFFMASYIFFEYEKLVRLPVKKKLMILFFPYQRPTVTSTLIWVSLILLIVLAILEYQSGINQPKAHSTLLIFSIIFGVLVCAFLTSSRKHQNHRYNKFLLNEYPISSDNEDKLGYVERAHRIRKGIENNAFKNILIKGDYGTGKSSLTNLITNHFENEGDIIVAISSWGIRSEFVADEILDRLLQELSKRADFSDCAQWTLKFNQIMKRNDLFTFNLANKFFNDNIQDLLSKLDSSMMRNDVRALIVFEDFDRTLPNQTPNYEILLPIIDKFKDVSRIKTITNLKDAPMDSIHRIFQHTEALGTIPYLGHKQFAESLIKDLKRTLDTPFIIFPTLHQLIEVLSPITNVRKLKFIIRQILNSWDNVKGNIDPLDLICVQISLTESPEAINQIIEWRENRDHQGIVNFKHLPHIRMLSVHQRPQGVLIKHLNKNYLDIALSQNPQNNDQETMILVKENKLSKNQLYDNALLIAHFYDHFSLNNRLPHPHLTQLDIQKNYSRLIKTINHEKPEDYFYFLTALIKLGNAMSEEFIKSILIINIEEFIRKLFELNEICKPVNLNSTAGSISRIYSICTCYILENIHDLHPSIVSAIIESNFLIVLQNATESNVKSYLNRIEIGKSENSKRLIYDILILEHRVIGHISHNNSSCVHFNNLKKFEIEILNRCHTMTLDEIKCLFKDRQKSIGNLDIWRSELQSTHSSVLNGNWFTETVSIL